MLRVSAATLHRHGDHFSSPSKASGGPPPPSHSTSSTLYTFFTHRSLVHFNMLVSKQTTPIPMLQSPRGVGFSAHRQGAFWAAGRGGHFRLTPNPSFFFFYSISCDCFDSFDASISMFIILDYPIPICQPTYFCARTHTRERLRERKREKTRERERERDSARESERTSGDIRGSCIYGLEQ